MPRKPSDLIQFKVRMRESLRKRLEKAAAQRGVTLTYDIAMRLERSFELESVRTLDMIATDYKNRQEAEHREDMQGALLVAAESLVAAVESGDKTAITTAIGTVKTVAKAIDIEAAGAKRRARS